MISTLRGTALALAAAFFAASGTAFANPPPWAHRGFQAVEENGRAHSVVSGTIAGIDYATASLLVLTPRGDRIPVAVTPSTSIFRGAGFASFAEIGRGAHVDIDVSDMAGHLVAQIIRIH